MKRCEHKNRKPADGYKVQCTDCGHVFLPRNHPIDHGTYAGYNRHIRRKSGEWCFPPGNCGCGEAAREWRQEYNNRKSSVASRKMRGGARFRALQRLRKVYPGAYSALYIEELARAGNFSKRSRHEIPVWDDVIARLVKVATGYDEHDLASRVGANWASRQEREVFRQLQRLRLILEGTEHGE